MTGPLQELSLLPCFLFLSISPSGPPSSFTLLQKEPAVIHPLLCSCLLFSCLCCVSLSSRPLLMLVLPLQCPSPMTSWQMHSRPSRPSSIVSCEQSLFPTCHPRTSADSEIHCHVPAQPMALFCLGSDVHLPRTCLLPHLGVPELAGGLSRGLLGLGLGGQKWKLPFLAPTVCRALWLASHYRPRGALSTRRAEPGVKPIPQGGNALPRLPRPLAPTGPCHPRARAQSHE